MATRARPAGALFLHSGSWPGWSATTERIPRTGTAVVVLAQSDDMDHIRSVATKLHADLI